MRSTSADTPPEPELLELSPSDHHLTGLLAPAGYTPEVEPVDEPLDGGTDDVTTKPYPVAALHRLGIAARLALL